MNKKVIFLSLSHVNILDLSCFFSVLYRDSEHDGDPAEPVLGIQEREEHFPAIQSAAGHDQGDLWNI